MTRMTSFLRLFVNKASKFHLFILYIALHLAGAFGCGLLLASGANGGRLRQTEQALLVLRHVLFHIILTYVPSVHS
jgi:hypothetical protein